MDRYRGGQGNYIKGWGLGEIYTEGFCERNRWRGSGRGIDVINSVLIFMQSMLSMLVIYLDYLYFDPVWLARSV